MPLWLLLMGNIVGFYNPFAEKIDKNQRILIGQDLLIQNNQGASKWTIAYHLIPIDIMEV